MVRAACGDRSALPGDEIIPPGLAFWGVVAGIVGMTAFMTAAGMTFGTALAYVLIIYACTLVYARIRAQTGLPITYGIPREEMYETILFLRPTPNGLTTPSAIRAETVFTVFQVFGRMTFGQLAAFQMEGIRIAQRAHLGRMSLVAAIIIGLLGGLTLATPSTWWMPTTTAGTSSTGFDAGRLPHRAGVEGVCAPGVLESTRASRSSPTPRSRARWGWRYRCSCSGCAWFSCASP